MTPEQMEEMVAARMWQVEAKQGTPPSVSARRTPKAFADEHENVRTKWLRLARAAIAVIAKAMEEPTPFDQIDVPTDIQEFGERHKIPTFASATYRNGYAAGQRAMLAASPLGGDRG